MKNNIILILAIILLTVSCQFNIDPGMGDKIIPLPTEEYGITAIIPVTDQPGSRSIPVSHINIIAKLPGLEDVITTLSWNGSAYTGSLNISAGEWIVSAEALNQNDILVYSGTTVFNTSTGSSMLIRLGHECGSIKIMTDEIAPGSMDTFQAFATRPGFDSITESVQIESDQINASLYLLNLTSGDWSIELSLLNGGYTYYTYTYNVSVATNELTERVLPLTPFLSKVLPVQFAPSDGIYPDGGFVNVSLSCATPNAQIRYTLNGEAPTPTSGNFYSPGSIINISEPTTIRAIAYDYTYLEDSNVTEKLFQPILPEVAFNIEGGTYSSEQTVILTCEATGSGASIYYILGNESFDSSSGILYEDPIPVSVSTSISAVARKTFYHDSPVTGNNYILQMPEVLISPDGGTFSTIQTVTLTCSNVGEGIYYTTDGSFPTSVNGTYYTGPFSLGQDTTLRAAAVKTGWASSPVEADFSILIPPTLLSPSEGASISDTTPLLDWSDVGLVTSYEVRYLESTGVLTGADVHTVEESEYLIPAELAVNTDYSWQVRALKADTESEWSPVGTFIVEIDGGITVVPHNDVIEITLDIEPGALGIVTDSTRVITATTDPVVDSFQWYLDGILIDGYTDTYVVIGDNLVEGADHTLTVIAVQSTAFAMASKSVDFIVNFIESYAGFEETMNAGSISFDMHYVLGKTFYTGMDDSETAAVSSPYWMGETDVTYEQWSTVYSWAVLHGYSFSNVGVQGDGVADTDQHPVTTINWRDSMVWCNAATEFYNYQNGTSLDCVYYSDSGYASPIRVSSDSEYTLSEDSPHVKSDAFGFRLPTGNEWELAGRYIADLNDDGDILDSGEYYPGDYGSGAVADYNDSGATGDVGWYSANSGESTHVVSLKTPNALGLYDMSGNVANWCFEWHPDYIPDSYLKVQRGNGWNAYFLIVGSNGSAARPYLKNNYTGMRLARTVE